MINDKNIYNLDYVVLLPIALKNEYEDALTSIFDNVIVFKNTLESVNYIKDFFKESNIKRVLFVNFLSEYATIMNEFSNEMEFDFIFTHSLSALSDENFLIEFNGIRKYLNLNLVKKLSFLDKSLYLTMKKKNKETYFIQLYNSDTKKISSKSSSNTIGILNVSWNPKTSFYNSLSGIIKNGKYEPKLIDPDYETRQFLELFNCKAIVVNEQEELAIDNIVNLCINFTDMNPLKVFDSFDLGVPCIVGNTIMFDDNKLLKKYLVLNSDDDVNEISDKIDEVVKNRKTIMQEYAKFRKEYIKNAEQQNAKFTSIKKTEKKDSSNNKLLLTVGVPVYNTENYLEKCLDSIIKARIDSMEIIIVNDGSKDNSEKIIKKYVKEYPDLIKYIKQENRGLGNVRNVIKANAKGKYIASVDSDDEVDEKIFKDALDALNDDVDIVIFDWMTKFSDTESATTPAIEGYANNLGAYKGLLYTTIMPSTCNKIFKKELIDEIGLNYPERTKYEDLGTNPLYLLTAKKIRYINKPYYIYNLTEGSIMRTSNPFDTSMITIIDILDRRIKEKKLETKMDYAEFTFYTYLWRIEQYIFKNIDKIQSEKEKKEFIKEIDKIQSILVDLYFNNKYYDKFINTLSNNKKEYFKTRNDSIKTKKLLKFYEKQKENIFLTGVDIFYPNN